MPRYWSRSVNRSTWATTCVLNVVGLWRLTMEIDRSEGNCDEECGPIVSEVADWKHGNPTGHYCQKCGYVFGYTGRYEP